MTQEDREISRDVEGEQVRGEVSPGGTEGGRRPTGILPGQGGVGPLALGPCHKEVRIASPEVEALSSAPAFLMPVTGRPTLGTLPGTMAPKSQNPLNPDGVPDRSPQEPSQFH
jgi:hypothetical protein